MTTRNHNSNAATAQPVPPPDSAEDVGTYAWRNGRLFHSCRPFPWRKDASLKDTLRSNGLESYPMLTLGDENDPLSCRIYGRPADDGTPPRYLADLTLAFDGLFVWLDDEPALIDLLGRLAPTIAAVAALSDRQDRPNEEAEERKAAARERTLWSGR